MRKARATFQKVDLENFLDTIFSVFKYILLGHILSASYFSGCSQLVTSIATRVSCTTLQLKWREGGQLVIQLTKYADFMPKPPGFLDHIVLHQFETHSD